MAPRPDLMTALGRDLLGMLPTFLREDPDVRSVVHCYARAVEEFEVEAELVRAQLSPLSATGVGLSWWERMLRLLAAEPGVTVEARREAVIGRWRSLDGDPAGRDWVRRVSGRLGGSVPWSYEENTPAPQTIRVSLPFDAGSPAWEEALRVFREETPAEQALVFISSGGFLLDESQMDVEGLGV